MMLSRVFVFVAACAAAAKVSPRGSTHRDAVVPSGSARGRLPRPPSRRGPVDHDPDGSRLSSAHRAYRASRAKSEARLAAFQNATDGGGDGVLDRIIRKRRSPLSARGQGRKGDLDARGWKGGFDAWRVNVNDTATLCSHGRVLPSLLLLGCMKCATTLLHKIIVKACPRTVTQGQRLKKESWFRFKEKHYFDRNETIEEGVRFYVQHYPRCPDESRAVVGLDSTQAYLKTPWAAPRAATTYGADAGRIRFIVVLREPVARLLSNYHHRRKSGGERAQRVGATGDDWPKQLPLMLRRLRLDACQRDL